MHPWYTDPLFDEKILKKKEIKSNALEFQHQPKRCLENYQYLVSNFINPSSPYNSLLLYFEVGVGKTSAAIAIAENFIRYENRKVIVLTKNSDLQTNFKKEILTVCSNYTNQEELGILNSDNESKKSKIYQKLRGIYSFITHQSIVKNDINFTGKVVIIDEIHNMLGNTGYDALKRILSKSKDYKLILLSATPIYDNVKDAFELNNVLNGFRTNLLPVRDELTKTNYIIRDTDVENISIFNDEGIYKLSDSGLKALKSGLKGRVVYLKQNKDTFPSSSDKGEYISIGNYTSVIKVINCEMSDFHSERYLKILKSNESNKDFNLILESASSIIYPDIDGKIVAGANGYNKNKDKPFFYKQENIEKHSTKLYNLLQNLKKSEGKVMIYSRYITGDGVELIRLCLNSNGYKGKYISLTSEKTSSERTRAIDRFNSAENDRGELLPIVILSGVASEGITFKCIREVHIYEPAWNFSGIDQVTGRAIRKNSHERLPTEDRNVKIFRYCAIPSNGDISKSSDASKYIKAGRKDVYIKQFERMLAVSNFACALNNGRNIQKGVNGSRECDYVDCNYTCDTVSQKEDDFSSYNVYLHNKELYKIILNDLIKLFNTVEIIDIDSIVKKLQYDTIDVQSVLSKVIKDDGPVKLEVKGKLYIKKSLANKYVENPNLKKLARLEDTYFVVNEISGLLRGDVVDGKFKIFEKPSSKGKICTSFKKDDLLAMFELLGKDKPKGTKEELCKKLRDILFKN